MNGITNIYLRVLLCRFQLLTFQIIFQSDEQVCKWEANKRRQVTNERLQNQLLDINRECDSLRLNNQRLRDNLMRMEKDRNSLELKLKSANGNKLYSVFYKKVLI